MLTSWVLMAWVGTTSNFLILAETWALVDCQTTKAQWRAELDAHIQLSCVTDLREGRSQYRRRNDIGVAK
jgi:hypothetical protein